MLCCCFSISGSDEEKDSLLPIYTPSLQLPVLCGSVRVDDTQLSSNSHGDVYRDLLRTIIRDVKRPLEAVLDAHAIGCIFLDVETILKSHLDLDLADEASILSYIKATMNEYGILYAVFPLNTLTLNTRWKEVGGFIHLIGGYKRVEAIFAHLVTFLDTFIGDDNDLQCDIKEAIGEYLELKSQLRESVATKRAEIIEFMHKLLATRGNGLEGVIQKVLPLVSKGRNLRETVQKTLNIHCIHGRLMVKAVSGYCFRTSVSVMLLLFSHYLLVSKRTRGCHKKFHVDVLTPIDAVKITLCPNASIIVAIPHLGRVINGKGGDEEEVQIFHTTFNSLLPSSNGTKDRSAHRAMDNTAGPENTPAGKGNGFEHREVGTKWPPPPDPPKSPVIGPLCDISRNHLACIPCGLYKFESTIWNSMGKSVFSLELSRANSEPVLVIRSKETGLVRLCSNMKDCVVEFYQLLNSFSMVAPDDASPNGKIVYQVRLPQKGGPLGHLERLHDYMTRMQEEWKEWRRCDAVASTILTCIYECHLQYSVEPSGLMSFVGGIRMFGNGKFEFNCDACMLVGWICKIIEARECMVYCHGALFRTERLDWCTLQFIFYQSETARAFSEALEGIGSVAERADPTLLFASHARASNAPSSGSSD